MIRWHRIALQLLVTGMIACGGSSDGSTGPGTPPPPAPPPRPPPEFPVPPLVATVSVPPSYGLHDTFVRDGIAFLSAWDTGIIILDVGGGDRGGTPSHPVEITRFRPNNGSLSSPAIHNSWWFHNPVSGEKRYLFVGQEGGIVLGSSSKGDIKVIDVSNLAVPNEVAYYRLPDAGTHNFWMNEARQILYAAFYNGGVVALDVSGHLSGDLSNRELARVRPAAGSTYVWGVMLSGGSLYATDMVNGFMQLDPLDLHLLKLTGHTERWSSDLWISGNTAYSGTWGERVGNLGDLVQIWQLSASGTPTLADSIKINSLNVSDLEVSDNGRLLVVSAEPGIQGADAGLNVYRLTNPLKPTKVAFAPAPSGIHTVTLGRIGGKLYAFAARNPFSPALVIYDLSQFDN